VSPGIYCTVCGRKATAWVEVTHDGVRLHVSCGHCGSAATKTRDGVVEVRR